MPTPTVADIDRIAALTDPVVRNLQITQCYYELSARLIERTGPAANWCTYATWASKQAGQTIRKADLGQTLKRVVTSPPALNNVGPMPGALVAPAAADDPVAAANTTLWELLDPTAPFDRASEAVARGNRKVFAEIGRVFAAFAGACLDDETPDDAKIAAFCAALRPGPPPDGQEYLRRAFARYYAALFTADAKARAEHLYFANLAIGFHEQTRLQPEIVAALDAPIPDASRVARQLGAALLPYPRLLALPWLYLRRLLGRPLLVEQVAAAAVARGAIRRPPDRHRALDDDHAGRRGLSAVGARSEGALPDHAGAHRRRRTRGAAGHRRPDARRCDCQRRGQLGRPSPSGCTSSPTCFAVIRNRRCSLNRRLPPIRWPCLARGKCRMEHCS
jgi:hypothetical protein